MANKNLFASLPGRLAPATDAVNREQAPAYNLPPKQALAQYVMTGCLNRTFYATASEQAAEAMILCDQVDPEFVAKAAVFSRKHGHMKDMPALLCAWLSAWDGEMLKRAFPKVIDNGKMLRNFVQIVRSGVTGRKSLGTLPKRLVQGWLHAATDAALLEASIGQDPSLADVLKMVHPRPASPAREALFRYFLGKPVEPALLPEALQAYEALKAGRSGKVPAVPFQMLTSLPMGRSEWSEVARNASWQATRMNLNAFLRHGVFAERGLVRTVANRLRDADAIARARVFPYQLMAAYMNADRAMPGRIKDALKDALEIALSNVPEIGGKVVVCPDVSGSMSSPVTGRRAGSTTSVRCIDVAALVAAAILRKNRQARVLPFEQDVVDLDLDARHGVMKNAAKLAAIGGGGTDCSAPLRLLNREVAKADLVVFVSDNESWMDPRGGRGTATMREWEAFRARNPGARLACIDIQPNATTQARGREDILNVGGFSDHVFEVLSDFAAGRMGGAHWTGRIEAVEL